MWRQEVRSVELVSGGPDDLPATYRETIVWEGITTQATLKVTESIPGRRIVIAADDAGYHSRSVWTFDPQGDETICTLTFSLETAGTLRVTEPLLWALLTRWLERDLPMLQGHLQSALRPSSVPQQQHVGGGSSG